MCELILYTHTHSRSRLYPWWGLVCPSPQLISVSWQRNPSPTPQLPPPPLPAPAASLPKVKKIDGSSIYWLAGQTTAREPQFTGDGWLIGTSIWKKIFIKLITAWLVIASGEVGAEEVGDMEGNERHILIPVSLARCQLHPHVGSISNHSGTNLVSYLRQAVGKTLHVTRVLSLSPEVEGESRVLFTSSSSSSRQYNLLIIDHLINLSSLPGAHKPRWNLSHLLTSPGCALVCNLQCRLRSSWHLPTMHSSLDPTGACNGSE